MFASLAGHALFGIDSFAVCLALGPLGLASRRPTRIIMAFGLCDGLALLVGSGFPLPETYSVALVPVLIVLWIALVLRLMMAEARLLPLLPVLLSADNLLAGMLGGGAVTLYQALASALVSAALAAAGLIAGVALAPRLHHRRLARIAGASWLFASGWIAIAS